MKYFVLKFAISDNGAISYVYMRFASSVVDVGLKYNYEHLA